jgi:hypothetical protein
MKKLVVLMLMIVFPLSYFTGCKKDKGEPPLVPPYETMEIDFSNFTTQKKSAEMVSGIKGTENSTWEFAAAVSGVWSSLIASNIEIPKASFKTAANYKAAYLSEKLWQWSYDYTVAGVTYKAKLKGQISTNTVTWKMYITKDISGGYTDFLWVEGTSKADGSQGQWIFNQSPQSSVALFHTDWTISGDVVTSVKYTYFKSDANKDSFITYLLTNGNLDAGFNIHFSNDLYSDSNIEWNTTTNNGRLKCVDYMQDDNWYCWDNNKANKVCE